MSGFQYFLAFVDDYFRISWVYLLKERTRFSIIVIKDFISEIKAQFSNTIRVLRTHKYTQKNSHFCASHNILHQTTRPHTS